MELSTCGKEIQLTGVGGHPFYFQFVDQVRNDTVLYDQEDGSPSNKVKFHVMSWYGKEFDISGTNGEFGHLCDRR